MDGETWRESLEEYLAQPAPVETEALRDLVRGLADWPKPAWVAAALGALDAHRLLRPITYPDVERHRAAAEDWLACPCPRHAQLAREALVKPQGLWGNCNDLLHVSRIAAYSAALAASPEGTPGHAVRAAVTMAHPLVFDPPEVWAAIQARLRLLIGAPPASDAGPTLDRPRG
ncbi:MAG TPA: hypothetical protein VGE07_22050 [Herpetosiphonaceae bacterium]